MDSEDLLRGGTYPPYGAITHDDHGSYVIIGTWVFACISMLFVLVRVVLRTWTARRFGLDNVFIVAALFFAIAGSISASEAVRYGLGKRFHLLSKPRVLTYYRLIFVADLLATFVFVLSKLSLIHLFNRITPSKRANAFFSYFATFTILWGIAYVFSHSFQCGVNVPKRAYDSRCVSEAGLIYTHGVINILTDALIIFIPAFIIWKIQIPRKQKILITGLFFSRLCVCVTVSMRLGTVERYLSGEDPTWNYLLPTLWNQVSIHLSIITACIPSIKPFFDSLQSSLVDSSIPRNYTPQNVFEMNLWKSSKKSSSRSSRAVYSLRGMGLATTVHNEIEGGAAGDSASTKGLTDNVIHEQREVDVVIAEASTVSGDSRFL